MTDTHGALMDQVYRRQRLVYDATRKYYLLGRDHALRQLQPAENAHVLEIACGTGRNLDQIDMRYPERSLYGLDISSEMLISANAKLGDRAKLALGDACDFDPADLFGQATFDRIVMSYCVSMIPAWQNAIAEAVTHLAPDGELHIVDFGDQAGMPRWFDRRLRGWLARFHVKPRDDLPAALGLLPEVETHHQPLLRGYAQYARVSRIS
ncbi:class I SAM-dependent methyltransferase [Cognatiyoonia sp. IB215182]|uniref:class I SAM-dependent methyltransferase n=1 Tax=Cognatiyoonia sp. IB215182 TaxID=3097353 RepID=UPI002A0C1620|nr:class I SAM-dependent methyltransferase [Cognatiyoonia sp. IB215182]MDX8354896.1 class I SAM-dependent methyltransferase [Cognatiyoonia sp. IB215182]